MGAHQERGGELADPVSDKRGNRRAHHHLAIGGLFEQHAQRFAETGALQPLQRGGIGIAARRLGDAAPYDKRKQQPRQADHHKGHAPAFDCAPVEAAEHPAQPHAIDPRPEGRAVEPGKLPAEQRGQHSAQRHTQRIDRYRRGAAGRLEIVGDQRLRRRGATRLADAHPDAEQEQAKERGGKTAQGGKQAPYRNRNGDDHHPVVPFSQPRNRNAEEGVEHRKGRPTKQAHLPVLQPEAGLDRFGQDVDDGTVDEVEHIDQQQRAQHIAAIARRAKALGHRRVRRSRIRLRHQIPSRSHVGARPLTSREASLRQMARG